QAKRRVLQDPPANYLLFRGLAHRRICSRVDVEGNRDFANVFNFNCRRRPYSRQSCPDRGPAADDQSLSQQTADLQRRLEDLDLPGDGHAHSLSGAAYRFLAANRQLCRGQQGATGENHLAAFLGYPDHSVRPYCHVLHDARTGPRDWEGKGAADILRPDAGPGSMNAYRKIDLTTDYADNTDSGSQF